jgi:hypothetical protein
MYKKCGEKSRCGLSEAERKTRPKEGGKKREIRFRGTNNIKGGLGFSLGSHSHPSLSLITPFRLEDKNSLSPFHLSNSQISPLSRDKMAPPKVTPELIAQVRSKVLEMYEKEKEMYEESDIARLKTEDLLVSRYLTREQLDPLAAIETMNGAFRWAKRQGMGKIAESEFSPELLSLVQYQGKDKNGNRTVYIRYKTAKKIVKRNSKVSLHYMKGFKYSFFQ